MKMTLLAFALLASNSLFAEMVTLNGEQINLGALNQDDHSPAYEQITIERTNATPRKVTLTTSYNYSENFCAEYSERLVCRELPETICYPTPYGGQACRTVWRRFCNYETYCTRTESQIKTAYESYVLEFTLAKKLSEGETELFNITFAQKDLSKNLKLKGTALKTSVEYLISGRGPFAKEGLYFKENVESPAP